MARRKLHRFNQNATAENVIERGKSLYTTVKGRWNEVFFKNKNDIVLEIACGKGEYTVGLGQLFSDKNFIGIDIKGDRIARGSQRADELGLKNVGFLRTGVQYLDEFFVANEVAEIWIVHPDPHPKDKDEKRRLTNPKFLKLYKSYLKDDGILHLKTDNAPLFKYSLQVLQQDNEFEMIDFTHDLYQSDLNEGHYNIITYYETMFTGKGEKIHYLKAKYHKKSL